MKNFKHNFLQVLISLDQFIHCLIGLFLGYKVYADETFSSYQYRRSLLGKTRIKNMIDCIFHIIITQENHCKESYDSERLNRHLPPEMRD